MNKKYLIAFILGVILSIPMISYASVGFSSVLRDTAGFLRPPQLTDYIKAEYFVATSTGTSSIFPTITSSTVCIGVDCRTAWPTAGGTGGGTWSTTTSTVAGQLINYPNNNTDIPTIGSTSTTTAKFYFDPNTSRSFLTYASSTGLTATSLFATTICLSGDTCRTTWPTGGASGGYSFTPTVNYGANNQATTGIMWFQNGMNASTTSNFVYASSTQLTVFDSAYLATTGFSPSVLMGTTTFAAGVKAVIASGANPVTLMLDSTSATGMYTIYRNSSRDFGYIGSGASLFTGSSGALTDFSIRASQILSLGVGSGEDMRINANGLVGIATTSPASTLDVYGSFATRVTTITATTTLDSTYSTVRVDTTSNAVGVNLPPVAGACGRHYLISKKNSGSLPLTIDGSGSETIAGSLTQTITSQHTSLHLQATCDDNSWLIL